jgi:hypothetical protein
MQERLGIQLTQSPCTAVWDMETGECTRRIAAGQDTIWCSQFLDQNTVISGGADIRVLACTWSYTFLPLDGLLELT